MTNVSENANCVQSNQAQNDVLKSYEAPTLVELDVDATEAGGPGATDAGILW